MKTRVLLLLSALAAALLAPPPVLAQQGTLRAERIIITNKDDSVYPPNDFTIRNSDLDPRVHIGVGVNDNALLSFYNELGNRVIELNTLGGFNMLMLSTEFGTHKVAAGLSNGPLLGLMEGRIEILGEDLPFGLDAYTTITGGHIDTNHILVRTTNAGRGMVQWDDGLGLGGVVSLTGFNGPGAQAYTLAWPQLSPAFSGCNPCFLTSTPAGQLGFSAAPSGAGLPVPDSTFLITGSDNPTRRLRLEIDGFTPGASRVITVQNSNYTLAGLETNQTFLGSNQFDGPVWFGHEINIRTFPGGGLAGRITSQSTNFLSLLNSTNIPMMTWYAGTNPGSLTIGDPFLPLHTIITGDLFATQKIRVYNATSSGSPASPATHKIPIYNSSGTLLNYVYLYP